jgi:Family of unknown function (DUF6152)
MNTIFKSIVTGLGLACLAVPAIAHHSFSVEYDVAKPVKVTGTVTKLEWTNPHAHLYVDGVDQKGNKTNWNFEMASPNILERNGWTRKAVKATDAVVVEGYAGRVDATRAVANSIKFADGKALFAGAPDQPGN